MNERWLDMPNNPKQTSKSIAKEASKQLKDKAIPKKQKGPIASALAQAPYKKK